MILSYHPCYEADRNIICAGRRPDDNDLSAIRRATAVILPQGCGEALYRMASGHCAHVFPNYAARFRYPGKTGQTRLFQDAGMPHPRTWVFDDTRHFRRSGTAPAGFPLVFKLDWGGEGQTVRLLASAPDLARALAMAATYERSGQRGFIIQEFVHGSERTLRVAVIGQTYTAYWRIQDNPLAFGTCVANGARIDRHADPALRSQAVTLVRRFCQQSRIDLAGFDLIFDESGDPRPLLLEINYFFGRTGLGGSACYYAMLQTEIDNWLAGLGLQVQRRAPYASSGQTP